jgi:predicted nucleic acid-binding protein
MDTEVVIDASVWVSRLRPQDVNYDASRLWIERYTATGGTLIAPLFLMIEVAAAISRRTEEATLARVALEELKSTNIIHFLPMDSDLVQAAVNIALDLQLRAGDATYLAAARQLNIPLVSWDKVFSGKGARYFDNVVA